MFHDVSDLSCLIQIKASLPLPHQVTLDSSSRRVQRPPHSRLDITRSAQRSGVLCVRDEKKKNLWSHKHALFVIFVATEMNQTPSGAGCGKRFYSRQSTLDLRRLIQADFPKGALQQVNELNTFRSPRLPDFSRFSECFRSHPSDLHPLKWVSSSAQRSIDGLSENRFGRRLWKNDHFLYRFFLNTQCLNAPWIRMGKKPII